MLRVVTGAETELRFNEEQEQKGCSIRLAGAASAGRVASAAAEYKETLVSCDDLVHSFITLCETRC